jgi:hypothetical protein
MADDRCAEPSTFSSRKSLSHRHGRCRATKKSLSLQFAATCCKKAPFIFINLQPLFSLFYHRLSLFSLTSSLFFAKQGGGGINLLRKSRRAVSWKKNGEGYRSGGSLLNSCRLFREMETGGGLKPVARGRSMWCGDVSVDALAGDGKLVLEVAYGTWVPEVVGHSAENLRNTGSALRAR